MAVLEMAALVPWTWVLDGSKRVADGGISDISGRTTVCGMLAFQQHILALAFSVGHCGQKDGRGRDPSPR